MVNPSDIQNAKALILTSQFEALREEIIWINTSKLILIQAKVIWAGTIIGGLLAYSSNKGKSIREIITLRPIFTLFIIGVTCIALPIYDLVFLWLSHQVVLIGSYIHHHIEPAFQKVLMEKFEMTFWETFFIKTKWIHGPFLGLAAFLSSVLTQFAALTFLAFNRLSMTTPVVSFPIATFPFSPYPRKNIRVTYITFCIVLFIIEFPMLINIIFFMGWEGAITAWGDSYMPWR